MASTLSPDQNPTLAVEQTKQQPLNDGNPSHAGAIRQTERQS